MFPKLHDYIVGLEPVALTALFVFACWCVIGIGAVETYFCERLQRPGAETKGDGMSIDTNPRL
jgi:hypothetical protein